MNPYRPYVAACATAVAAVVTVYAAATVLTLDLGGLIAAIAITVAAATTVASFVTVIVVLEIEALETLTRNAYQWFSLLRETRDGRPRSKRNRELLRNPFAAGRLNDHGHLVHLPANATTVERLAAFLLQGALMQLPPELRERWAEEWAEHGSQHHGWRLTWWALCVRATATRTGREYRRALVSPDD